MSILPISSYAQDVVKAEPTKKELRAIKRQKKKEAIQKRINQKKVEQQLEIQRDSIQALFKKEFKASSANKKLGEIKKVINKPTKTAKEELLKSKQLKEVKKEIAPELKKYSGRSLDEDKDKLALLHADSATIAKEAKNTTKKALLKTDEYKELKEDFSPQIDIVSKHKGKLKLLKADSTTIANEVKKTAQQELHKTQEVKDIKKEIAPYIDSPFIKGIKLEDLDSMSVEDLQALRVKVFENVEEEFVAEALKQQELVKLKEEMAEIEALKGLPEAYRKQFEAYKNGESVKNEALTKAVKEAQKMLAKNSPALTTAQADLAKLKKKYSSVPSSDDLSTATKRNSLKGKPFKTRLVIGGNFQVVTSNPVVIDISPVLGYRFNRDFHLAIGATFRARFSSHDSTYIKTNYGRDELTYGYRAFANYRFWKTFFVHAEYERISKEFAVIGTDRFTRVWKPGALAGIGSAYTIKGALKGNVSLLYNFIHDDKQQVYHSPWVFRFGVNLALE